MREPQDNAGWTLGPADWARDQEALMSVRLTVFVEEQKVPVEIEQDAFDPVSRHVLARDRSGRPIATGRLLPDGHIGRVAVLAPWRRRGLGRAVMQRLIDLAQEAELAPIALHAQTQALAFYESLGFRARGPEFLEAGIRHRAMVLAADPADDGTTSDHAGDPAPEDRP